MKKRPLVERLWEKVDKRGPDDCWNWTACKDKDGYGQITYKGKRALAHRVSVYLATGEWPTADKYVCHTCNNPGCVNPSHIYVGTHQDNMDDMVLAGSAQGENNGYAKLNNKKVSAIRKIYALGNITHKQLGRLYEVSHTTISNILNNKTWKHVV